MNDQQLLPLVVTWASLATAFAWIARPRWQPLLIALCGVGLLAVLSPTALLLLGLGTVFTFAVARRGAVSKCVLVISIVLIAAVYAGFVLASRPASTGFETRIVLPMGLAFFSLRLIHYVFESYKGTLPAHRFTDYLCYQFLPSALPAGPIHRFDEFQRDLRRKRWDSDGFSRSAQRILYGLAKIVVLGNYFLGEELTQAWRGALSQSGLMGAYLSALMSWAKLYVLFSGYSDVGIGFAAAMGFKIRENFIRPYLARNIREFWQRWHFSLSSWCRDYVFMPVLSASRMQGFAVFASMVVLGLWHDLSLRYFLWGAYHGAGIAAFRWFDAKAGARIDALPPGWSGAWSVFATVITLHFVLFSFQVTAAIQRLIAGT
jgi:alginate O-acetyltransferase complex protein AlgI